jgi:hypothetical protein
MYVLSLYLLLYAKNGFPTDNMHVAIKRADMCMYQRCSTSLKKRRDYAGIDLSLVTVESTVRFAPAPLYKIVISATYLR